MTEAPLAQIFTTPADTLIINHYNEQRLVITGLDGSVLTEISYAYDENYSWGGNSWNGTGAIFLTRPDREEVYSYRGELLLSVSSSVGTTGD